MDRFSPGQSAQHPAHTVVSLTKWTVILSWSNTSVPGHAGLEGSPGVGSS